MSDEDLTPGPDADEEETLEFIIEPGAALADRDPFLETLHAAEADKRRARRFVLGVVIAGALVTGLLWAWHWASSWIR